MSKGWVLQRGHRRNQHRSPRVRWIDLGTTAVVVVFLLGLTVARAEGGRVLAWGLNNYGQTTVPAGALSGVSLIAGGGFLTLALKNGRVLAWGLNAYGETTVPEEALSGVTQIAAGEGFTLALKNGRVLAWGKNSYGQTTVPEEALSGVTRIAAGKQHGLALKNGRVLAWGYNGSGEINVPAEALSGVTEIACGSVHSLAVKNGRVLAWGYNGDRQINVPAEALSGVTQIAAGQSHSLALKDGAVLAWGYIGYTNVPAEALSGVTQIAAGQSHSLALKDGRVLAWGDSANGQTDVPAEALSGVAQIAGGGRHSVVLFPDEGAPNLSFPHWLNGLVAGQPNRTRIVLRNNSNQQEAGIIQFRNAGGSPVSVPVSGSLTDAVAFTLAPWGTFEVETAGTGALLTGTIDVFCGRGSASAAEGTEVFDVLGHFVSVPSAPPRSTNQIYVSVSAQENTGVALYNPDKENTVSVNAILVDSSGIERATRLLGIEPGRQRLSFVHETDLFSDYFSEHPESFTGTLNLIVEGEGSVSVLGLLQKRQTDALIAVAGSEHAYNP
jgi:hypothetical protein